VDTYIFNVPILSLSKESEKIIY